MNIGILAVDSNFPNLALMKISAYHKARGDQVEWYNPLCKYDKVYAAKVFTFTPDYNYYINANQIEKGGTGYDIEKVLPIEVDRLQPDYSIYNIDSNLSYGFLTRGCPNRCKWWVVPKKEGKISPYMDIEEITAGRKKAILMDNNILASNYGLQQIEKIIKLGIKVDFNQGLDARLITDEIARLLAKVKWIKRIRFGCDTPGQIAKEKFAEYSGYLTNEAMLHYLCDMVIAQGYAAFNRKLIIQRIIRTLSWNATISVETVHNYISFDDMIIRKGAIAAYANDYVVIPMNMADGILLCRGKGNKDWNYSAPHGAGRLYSRSEAKERLSMDAFKTQMSKVYSTSVCEGTLDESPMAYKNVQEIKELIEPTVEIIDTIVPLINIKAV